MKTVAVRRPPGHVLDAHVKSLNYLNLVMAKIEAELGIAAQETDLELYDAYTPTNSSSPAQRAASSR